MTNLTLVDTIVKGVNNPECAFFVGQTLGQLTTVYLITKIALIYFGLKLLDKIVFTGIPLLYKKIKSLAKKKGKKK